MKRSINKGERAFTLWMLTKIEGVDRIGGRIVAKLKDALDLDDVMTVPIAEMYDEQEVELGEIEGTWILDQIEQFFKGHKVPIHFAEFAFSLEDKIKGKLADD